MKTMTEKILLVGCFHFQNYQLQTFSEKRNVACVEKHLQAVETIFSCVPLVNQCVRDYLTVQTSLSGDTMTLSSFCTKPASTLPATLKPVD